MEELATISNMKNLKKIISLSLLCLSVHNSVVANNRKLMLLFLAILRHTILLASYYLSPFNTCQRLLSIRCLNLGHCWGLYLLRGCWLQQGLQRAVGSYYLLPSPKAQTLIYSTETLHGQMPLSKPCHATVGLKRGELWRRWISRIKRQWKEGPHWSGKQRVK